MLPISVPYVLDGCRHVSPERSFDAANDMVIRFWCRPALIRPLLMASLVKHDLAITLQRE